MRVVSIIAPGIKPYEVRIPRKIFESIESKYDLVKLSRIRSKSSYRFFSPRAWDSECIGLHPIVCSGMSADFDGDVFEMEIIENTGDYELKEIYTGIFPFPVWTNKKQQS
jgi:hypothetical protein